MNSYLCIVAVFSAAVAAPAALLDSNDSTLVGSEVKEHIQPFEDLHAAGSMNDDGYGGSAEKEFVVDDNEKGYYKSKSGKGNKGYKHYDSFHKKGGDKYGYEKHTSHGKKNGDGDSGSHFTKSSYSSDDGDKAQYNDGAGAQKVRKMKKVPKDHKAAGTGYSYSHYESDGDDSGHYEGDDGHYEDDSGHYTEGDHGNYGYEGGDGESEHYDDEGDSGAYHDESYAGYHDGGNDDSGSYTEGSSAGVGPSGATSYYIRHY